MKRTFTDVSYTKSYLLLITILSLSELTNQQKSLKIERKSFLLICQFFLLTFLCNLNQVQAQIIPDATVNSKVTSNGTRNIIEGGTRAGNNLFHSFREFSISTGREAFFNNAVDIRNIFSRVTGSSISNIDGLIRANGTANLFLLNPNGIIFGPNARLNIGGSFFASTANSFKFTDGLEFAANNPQSPALLSVNVPIGLQYGKSPGEIRVQGNSSSSLKVLPGKALTILGGNVTIDGGILEALGGRIELGGVSSEGTVELTNDGSLSFPENLARADVSIINQAEVRVLNSGGGSITVKARNLDISGESLLSAGIATGKGTPKSVAGDIFLDATDAITIASSQVENIVEENAIGNSSTIKVNAKSLTLTNGSQLDASTLGKGKAGDIEIVIGDRLLLDGENNGDPSGILATVQQKAEGEAGNINIITNSLSITNGAQIGAATFGFGKAGEILIQANSVSLDGEGSESFSSIISGVEENGIGDGRGITINTQTLTLTNGAQINASTFGKGKAGRITINASEIVSFDGEGKNGFATGAFGIVGENAEGEADGIEINTRSLSLTNGAELGVSTLGIGKAGKITIKASESVSFDGETRDGSPSGAFGIVDENAIGEADGIEINTSSLSLTNGALIDTSTLGRGKAGIINIVADTISLDGESQAGFPTEIRSEVGENAIGEAGGIDITTNSLFVANSAQLSANTLGKGAAGEVRITASDRISFDGINSGAFSIVEKGATGKAGGVTLETRLLTISNGAELGAGTFGEGNSGSVKINTNELWLTNNGSVSTNVGKEAKGNSGNINIIAGRLILNNQSYLNAASEKGEGGNITIQSRDIQLRRQSEISAASALDAKEGNIDIATRTLALLEASEIRTDADAPKGGSNITISPIDDFGVAVFVSADSVISASGNLLIEGYIESQSSDIPQVEVVDATKLVVSTCRSREGEESEFIITGKGGLPSSPNESLKNDALWLDLRPINLKAGKAINEEQRNNIEENSENEIVEAQGWFKNAKGEVILVTKTTKVIPQNSTFYYQNCVE